MDVGTLPTLLAAIAVAVAAVVAVFDKFGLLERLGIVRPSSINAAAELSVAEHTIERLREERNRAREQLDKLEQTRSLEPVLDLVGTVAGICEQTLEKLGHFNGSLRHVEEGLAETRDGLRDAAEGMKTMTGLIAELHGLPVPPAPARERKAA